MFTVDLATLELELDTSKDYAVVYDATGENAIMVIGLGGKLRYNFKVLTGRGGC